jgi:hypothetical protein
LKRVRAAALKHGRYSRIERQLAELVAHHARELQTAACATRDPLLRAVLAGAGSRLTHHEQLEALRDALLLDRLAARARSQG